MKPNKKTKPKINNELNLVKAENVALHRKNKALVSHIGKLSKIIDTLIVDWRKADADLADACWETTKKVTSLLEKLDFKANKA